jgi:hypothetical protein
MPKERNFANQFNRCSFAKKDLECAMTRFRRLAYSDHRVDASLRQVASTIEKALSISLEPEVRQRIVDLIYKDGEMRRDLHRRMLSRSTEKPKGRSIDHFQ